MVFPDSNSKFVVSANGQLHLCRPAPFGVFKVPLNVNLRIVMALFKVKSECPELDGVRMSPRQEDSSWYVEGDMLVAQLGEMCAVESASFFHSLSEEPFLVLLINQAYGGPPDEVQFFPGGKVTIIRPGVNAFHHLQVDIDRLKEVILDGKEYRLKEGKADFIARLDDGQRIAIKLVGVQPLYLPAEEVLKGIS